MRKALSAFAIGLLALELMSVAGTAQIVPHVLKPVPPSLKTVPVPEPVGITAFVKDKPAAIALGKALFWDMQVGGDGLVACASCHFHAGADRRTTNQLNPGANGVFDLPGLNHMLTAPEFPFHKLLNTDDRGSTQLRSRDEVSGSQGVHAADFIDVVPGSSRDLLANSAADPLGFVASGLNVRRTTGRNSPSAINAVYNIRNFWDGRANRRFNGRNPFGDADPNARVLQVNDLGELEAVRISIDRASLASQAVGPAISDVEMSGTGRTWMKLGKKMLTLVPLALQEVKADDSVLGPLAVAGGKGLTSNYADMIRAAFQDKWWNSNQVVDDTQAVQAGVTVPTDGTSLPSHQYSLMEANFSMFWGLAIAAYEATLVSDDAPYDKFQEGVTTALTKQQQFGLLVFMGKAGGNCIACHFGAEFTGATFNTRLTPEGPGGPIVGVMERMIMGDGTNAVYDGGFYNLGVRPTGEDVGVGANDPFGNPLSFARQEMLNPGSVADNHMASPIVPGERVTANGAFKTPSLRNCELTGPYFHNGSEAALSDVVKFYARGGNFNEQNIADLDFEMIRQIGLIGHPNRQIALTNFLRSLTDERVRWDRAPFDHPELIVANGSAGSELSVLQDLRFGSQAADVQERVAATGRNGATEPLKSFLNVPVFDGKTLPAPNPVYSDIALFATDTMTVVNTSADVMGDVWCSGNIQLNSKLKHTFLGDITSGGSVTVTGDTTVFQGSIMARGPVTLAPTTLFKNGVAGGNVEYFAPMQQQPLTALPVLPLIRGTVNVPQFAIQTLTPGRYGEVTVGSGAWLTLMNGTYVFKKLALGAGAFLQYDPDGVLDTPIGPLGEMTIAPLERTTIHITESFTLARGAIVSQGDALLSTHLRVYFRARGDGVRLPQNSFFHGTLIAPLANVTLGQLSNTQGAIYAKSVRVADGAVFRPHFIPIFGPLPGTGGGLGALMAGPTNPEDATAASAGLGLTFSLGQNAPNPFRSSTLNTAIHFSLPTEREVELRVFDVAGRSVKTLAKGRLSPGVHTLAWDGSGDKGTRLASGVYFYRLLAGPDHALKKMVMID
jgi:cytochrome c peroxidase